MTEADITPKVFKYIRDTLKRTCAVEVKLARNGSLPFSALAEHQERALLLANNACIYHKISDGSGQQTPFDGFVLCGVPAYVAVVYGKTLELITVGNFVFEREKSKRKSLTAERAHELSTVTARL